MCHCKQVLIRAPNFLYRLGAPTGCHAIFAWVASSPRIPMLMRSRVRCALPFQMIWWLGEWLSRWCSRGDEGQGGRSSGLVQCTCSPVSLSKQGWLMTSGCLTWWRQTPLFCVTCCQRVSYRHGIWPCRCLAESDACETPVNFTALLARSTGFYFTPPSWFESSLVPVAACTDMCGK
jgi:hypothetical protein